MIELDVARRKDMETGAANEAPASATNTTDLRAASAIGSPVELTLDGPQIRQ
jgi:hypothetical protein